MMKKRISIALCAVLLIALLPLGAFAVRPGDTVSVTIRVSTSASTVKVRLNYDANVFEFAGAAGGTQAPAGKNGHFCFGNGSAPIGSASGTVTLRVKEEAKDGTYYVGGTAFDCYYTDRSPASCSVSGGSVTVSASGEDPKEKKGSAYSSSLPSSYVFTLAVEDGETGETEQRPVTVVSYGLSACNVRLDGRDMTVNAKEITFSEDVKEDHRLAIVWGPSTGKVSLRKTEKPKSAILIEAQTGVVVPVLALLKDVAYVDYLGQKGFIQLKSLRFYAPGEYTGTASVYNKTADAVYLRLSRDSASQKVCRLENGTTVYITKEFKDWYELDANGCHGFLLKKYIRTE